MKIQPVVPEQVLEDAELAASYLRALTEKGVPAQAAMFLTSSYLGTVVGERIRGEQPKPPWE